MQTFKEAGVATYSIIVRHHLHLFEVFCLGQQAQPFWVELATGRVEGLPVTFAQFSAKGVESNGKSTSVGLKLNLQDKKLVKSNHLLNAINRTL